MGAGDGINSLKKAFTEPGQDYYMFDQPGDVVGGGGDQAYLRVREDGRLRSA